MGLTYKSLFRFLSAMIMISAFLPLVFKNLPPIIRSHHLWTLLWFFSLIVCKNSFIKNSLVLYVLLYGAIMIGVLFNVLWSEIDYWPKRQVMLEFYDIIVATSVLAYYRTEQDYVGLAKTVKWTFYCIAITALMSIITSIINPLYARDIIGVDVVQNEGQKAEIMSYQKYGGGGYGFASSIICLFPIIIYFYKNSLMSYWSKKSLILFGILLFICLIRIQLFANILISFFTILICLLGSRNILKSIVFVVLLLSVLFIIPTDYYVDFFSTAANLFNADSELHYKLNDMSAFIISGGDFSSSGTGARAERYPMLLESFLSNPIIGGKYWDGHIYWMNKLAVFGLLGTIPFVFIIYHYVRKSIKSFDKIFIFYFLVSITSIIALGFMKTLSGRELWYVLFLILPGASYVHLLKDNKLEYHRTK